MRQILYLLLLTAGVAYGQTDSSKVMVIILNDGSEVKGFIVSEDNSAIQFETLSGVQMHLERTQIKEIEVISGDWDNGKFREQDPNGTRLLFAPTARTLKGGEGYFSVYEIFFPSIAVGIGDYFTLNGGMSLFPGADRQLLYIAPKVNIISATAFKLSAGTLYAGISGESFGFAYGVFTVGSSSAALTGGIGWGFVNGEFSENPAVLLGGEIQLSNSVKLLSENWILPEAESSIISFGIRFFGQHLAADFGLITVTEDVEGFPFIPWLGFAYNF